MSSLGILLSLRHITLALYPLSDFTFVHPEGQSVHASTPQSGNVPGY